MPTAFPIVSMCQFLRYIGHLILRFLLVSYICVSSFFVYFSYRQFHLVSPVDVQSRSHQPDRPPSVGRLRVCVKATNVKN